MIDGEDAVAFDFPNYMAPEIADRSVIAVSPRYGSTTGYKPKYINIENLEIRNAFEDYTYYDDIGGVRSHHARAASVYIERGDNITVKGNIIYGSGNGILVASGGIEDTLSRDILLDSNYIYGNGQVGTNLCHNVDTEALGITMQYNHFGPPRSGMLGSNIKDRSTATAFRYNWFEASGASYLLDLVEPEGSWNMVQSDPRRHETFVYGNIFISGQDDGKDMLHYGGDGGTEDRYRKGTLYFYNNTVVFEQDSILKKTIFKLQTKDETADIRNNIIYHKALAPIFTIMDTAGIADLGVNFMNDDYEEWFYVPSDGVSVINGIPNLITGSDAGFTDDSTDDFSLLVSSPALNAGQAQHANTSPDHDLTMEYIRHQKYKVRPLSGNLDLGAFERE